ncbi:DUF4238 domain-containing protein [Streptomyces koyangensis]|uniref:DUF4238 domain-containing protein n=1 Tax=Streptomyces koyangensis TaxID=188770 RepID=UPI003C2FB0C8
MKRPTKRRHHTVPKFYLDRFANGRHQLIRIELPGTKRNTLNVKDATVHTDFYLVEAEDGTWTDKVEDSLSEVEGAAATAIRTLIEDKPWPIPHQVREAIAGWTALQYLRTPAVRQAGSQILDMAVKLAIAAGGREEMRRHLEGIEGRPVTNAELDKMWEAMTAFDEYTLDAHPNAHIQTMSDLLPGTTRLFYSRAWNLVQFERKALITTDTPVVLLSGPGQDPSMPIGLATAGGVLVPLDRRVALIMGEVGVDDELTHGSAVIAQSLNQRLAHEARRYVFHNPEDSPLQGIVLPEPRTQEVETDDPGSFLREEPQE